MEIIRLFLPVLALDIARDVVHRPWTIEGHKGDDILELVRLKLGENRTHARTFKLKHADSFTPLQKIICFFVF